MSVYEHLRVNKTTAKLLLCWVVCSFPFGGLTVPAGIALAGDKGGSKGGDNKASVMPIEPILMNEGGSKGGNTGDYVAGQVYSAMGQMEGYLQALLDYSGRKGGLNPDEVTLVQALVANITGGQERIEGIKIIYLDADRQGRQFEVVDPARPEMKLIAPGSRPGDPLVLDGTLFYQFGRQSMAANINYPFVLRTLVYGLCRHLPGSGQRLDVLHAFAGKAARLIVALEDGLWTRKKVLISGIRLVNGFPQWLGANSINSRNCFRLAVYERAETYREAMFIEHFRSACKSADGEPHRRWAAKAMYGTRFADQLDKPRMRLYFIGQHDFAFGVIDDTGDGGYNLALACTDEKNGLCQVKVDRYGRINDVVMNLDYIDNFIGEHYFEPQQSWTLNRLPEGEIPIRYYITDQTYHLKFADEGRLDMTVMLAAERWGGHYDVVFRHSWNHFEANVIIDLGSWPGQLREKESRIETEIILVKPDYYRKYIKITINPAYKWHQKELQDAIYRALGFGINAIF